MKKRYSAAALAFGIYLLLLILLVAVESSAPDASITNFTGALWYSLVTMTTVGYGDAFPVTGIGKLIGVLFLMLSAGALTALITFGISWVNGTGLPGWRIRRGGSGPVYVFNRAGSEAQTLAENLLAENPDAFCIFAGDGGAYSGGNRRIDIQLPPEAVLPLVKNRQPTFLFIGEDAETRMAQAELPEGVPVVCQTKRSPEFHSGNVRYFERDALCAGMYWKRHPLAMDEKQIMFIGFGRLGRCLLEQGLLTNILSPIRVTEYHVFGDASEFLLDHPELKTSLSIGAADESRDSLIFHAEPWNSASELLKKADRILICGDAEEENIALYRRMRTWFPITAQMHVYCRTRRADSQTAFGMDSEVYTPELVLRAGLETRARQIHKRYLEAGGKAPQWEQLSGFLRASNLASADHLETKLRFLLGDDSLTTFTPEQMDRAFRKYKEMKETDPDLCRRIEHDRWMRFHAMYNWRYDAVRDNVLRHHPFMIPFDRLAEREQAKDDYAWELIQTLIPDRQETT